MRNALARRFGRPLDATRLTPFTWAMFCVLTGMAAASVPFFGFSVRMPTELVACALATAIILFLLRDSTLAARMPVVTLGCLVYVLFGLQSLAAIILSYTLLATNLPLADAVFLGIDRALGFDWLAFRQAVMAYPLLDRLLALAYASLTVQFVLVPILLLLAGQARRTETFLAAVIGCEIVACLVSAIWPCVSVANLDGFSTVAAATPSADHLIHFLPLRDGSLRVLDTGNLYGLITFPSFHCAGAYLTTAALWSLRWTRVPMLLLNGAMTFSAVTHGAHYLADCAAGIALAALVFPLCQHAVSRSAAGSRRRPATALATWGGATA